MSEELNPRTKHAVPWRGRRRVADAKNSFISVRCTAEDHAVITEAATQAGLSVGAYLRALALGSSGPRAVRRPPVERTELARILGWLGKLGSNVNQIAKAIHTTRNLPSWFELAVIREDIAQMRAAVMKALGRDHQG
jgi:hypothetical protein